MSSVHTEDYGWSSLAPESTSFIAPAVLRWLERLGAKRVLDLGCGNGSLTGEIARAGYEVSGCDADANGISIARHAHPGARFVVCDLGAAPQPELQGFDVVVSTEVIEHLYQPAQLLHFARAALRPGGKLILSTPYHGYWKNLALAVLDKWDHHHSPLWDGGHIKFWSRRTLSALLERNGFREYAFGGVGRVPYLWKSMIVVAEQVDAPVGHSSDDRDAAR